jgi:transposase-like protein
MVHGMGRRGYPPEFRRKVLDLLESGRKVADVARDLGISEQTANDPVITLKKAVENARPLLEVRSRRVGGANYQIPREVRPERRTTLAIRWIVGYARQRREKSMAQLCREHRLCQTVLHRWWEQYRQHPNCPQRCQRRS